LLSVAAREKTTGIESSIIVKPSYGLTDDEVARMLQDSFAHAHDDRDSRALAEQCVEADSLANAIATALEKDSDLLPADELARIETRLAALRSARQGRDHRLIKDAIVSLNEASEPFAARRMDRAVSGALAGRRVDEIRTK
jgi:molecular chaperone HscA